MKTPPSNQDEDADMRRPARTIVLLSLLGLFTVPCEPGYVCAQAVGPSESSSPPFYSAGAAAEPTSWPAMQASGPFVAAIEPALPARTALKRPAPDDNGASPSHVLPRRAAAQGDAAAGRGFLRAWTTGGALALVLGVFFVAAWLVRRAAPRSLSSLPADVVEVLGRATLCGKSRLHLVRLGSRLLLVDVLVDRAQTLAEVTDAREVDRLVALCERAPAADVSRPDRRILEQLSSPVQRPTAFDRGDRPGSYYSDDRASAREGRDG